MNKDEYEMMMNSDDWLLLIILKYKQDPKEFPIDLVKFRESLMESLCNCETGMALGIGWHGGMTSEEWESQKKYYERVKEILDTL